MSTILHRQTPTSRKCADHRFSPCSLNPQASRVAPPLIIQRNTPPPRFSSISHARFNRLQCMFIEPIPSSRNHRSHLEPSASSHGSTNSQPCLLNQQATVFTSLPNFKPQPPPPHLSTTLSVQIGHYITHRHCTVQYTLRHFHPIERCRALCRCKFHALTPCHMCPSSSVLLDPIH